MKNDVRQDYFFFHDLLKKNNEFLSSNQFKETYDISINTNFLQFYCIYHMIPRSWKDHIKKYEKKKSTLLAII